MAPLYRTQWLTISRIKLPIAGFPKDLAGFTLLQFSDLHLHPKVTITFTKKLSKTIRELHPDMIVFTGDFLCYGELTADKERLQELLDSCSAPYGCYAIFGNHDYAETGLFQ